MTVVVCSFVSGIGLALAERLLQSDGSVRVCLGCRNVSRAQDAQNKLQSKFPMADIDLVMIDVSCPASVYKAATVIRARFVSRHLMHN